MVADSRIRHIYHTSTNTDTLMQDRPRISYVTEGESPCNRLIIAAVERLSGQRRLQALYDSLAHLELSGVEFWGRALQALDIGIDVRRGDFSCLRQSGPTVVVANHPFGVVDGLALCHLTARERPDFKVILHKVLCQDRRVADHVLPIDFDPGREAIKNNVRSKRAAQAVLEAGGTVVIFPAGGVANAERFKRTAIDHDWKPLTTRLIESSQASVLPVYFHGQNSMLFQLSSWINPALRTGLLLNEVRNKIGTKVSLEVGELISYSELATLGSGDSASDYLRDAVYRLAPQFA